MVQKHITNILSRPSPKPNKIKLKLIEKKNVNSVVHNQKVKMNHGHSL